MTTAISPPDAARHQPAHFGVADGVASDLSVDLGAARACGSRASRMQLRIVVPHRREARGPAASHGPLGGKMSRAGPRPPRLQSASRGSAFGRGCGHAPAVCACDPTAQGCAPPHRRSRHRAASRRPAAWRSSGRRRDRFDLPCVIARTLRASATKTPATCGSTIRAMLTALFRRVLISLRIRSSRSGMGGILADDLVR